MVLHLHFLNILIGITMQRSVKGVEWLFEWLLRQIKPHLNCNLCKERILKSGAVFHILNKAIASVLSSYCDLFLLSTHCTYILLAWWIMGWKGCQMTEDLIFFHVLYELRISKDNKHALHAKAWLVWESKGFWLSILSLQFWSVTQLWGKFFWICSGV